MRSIAVVAIAASLAAGQFLTSASSAPVAVPAAAREVPAETMASVYDEVKTPFKYGIVLEPPPGKKVDCPNVFRFGGRWYMLYVQFEPEPGPGYSTQLAVSDDLLEWKPLGTALERGAPGSWDTANSAAGVALFDTSWGGSNTLERYEGRAWLSYLGGARYGYETPPLSIGLASTADPTKPGTWKKLPAPVLKTDDADVRPLETETLYKSHILRDDTRTLGAAFVMFYNAKPKGGSERIFTAVSDDLRIWRRLGSEPVIENLAPSGAKGGTISGDPQVVRIGDLWVMFYFGAFWKPGAFDTFACSYDLVHWTKWAGADLVAASEPFDTPYAHKPWLLKHSGVVYHFYCAVGGPEQHRAIALATSRIMK
jgi:beta-xylosidase